MISLVDLAKKFLSHIQLRLEPATFNNYRYDLNLMCSHLGQCGPKKVTTEVLDNYIRQRQAEGVSNRKINLELLVFRQMMNFAGYPLEVKPLKHVPKKNRRAMTPVEVRKLLRVAGRYREIFLTFLLTGVRKSELVNLTWADVDFQKKQLSVRDAKNKNKFRYLPIHPELLQILHRRRRKKHALEDRVFYVPATILKRFKKCLDRAGIEKNGLDVHALRVTFITALVNQGVNPKTCQELAGHNDIKTTLQFYVKATNGQHEKAVRGLKW